MITQIIKADPTLKKEFKKNGDNFIRVSEFFYDTIQGEGVNIGQPAAFLRVQGCTQNCVFCDTQEVWRFGNPYTYDELFELMERTNILNQLKHGQHLVFTGGSPLLQQEKIIGFLQEFLNNYDFLPYIEIENECVIQPQESLIKMVSCWNNSPKLTSSANPFERRYKPEVIHFMSQLKNSWFKFVVSNEDDWNEIDVAFLMPDLIKREQIILMPLGATRAELEINRQKAFEMAVDNNVRYITREHIVLWDKKTGV